MYLPDAPWQDTTGLADLTTRPYVHVHHTPQANHIATNLYTSAVDNIRYMHLVVHTYI